MTRRRYIPRYVLVTGRADGLLHPEKQQPEPAYDPRLCGQSAEAEETQPKRPYGLEGDALWARFETD